MPTPDPITEPLTSQPIPSVMRDWLRAEQQHALIDMEVSDAIGNIDGRAAAHADLRTLDWLLRSLTAMEADRDPSQHDYADWYAANAVPSGFTF